MIKVIDTQKTDSANVFGETLREAVFKDSYGCYHCFDLIDEFEECVENGELSRTHAYASLLLDADDDAVVKCFSNGAIVVAWYWDGDGTLMIKEGNRAAINTDCKKDSGWEWIKI